MRVQLSGEYSARWCGRQVKEVRVRMELSITEKKKLYKIYTTESTLLTDNIVN